MITSGLIKSLQKIMREDNGVSGDAQRMEQMVWIFFLKVYDSQEDVWEAYDDNFSSIIPEELRWRNWAVDNQDGKAKTGDELLAFVNNELFPKLKSLPITSKTPRKKSIVRDVFADINNYMKNGVQLRKVINEVNKVDFSDAEDRHSFGDMYEQLLKDLQSAGNAGEYYTPRALTDFIVETLNPQIGEKFADYTSGTGGFLTSTINHLKKQEKNTDDNKKIQESIYGQEWKPLPYLLSITNLLVHQIEEPNIKHGNSLAVNVQDIKDSQLVDVIGMNPPYGGVATASDKNNFPSDMQSSETADLFVASIMYHLKANGRAGVIIPDGFLFGTDSSAKIAIKTKLLRDFNLHTIIRLPGSVFSPYTPIATNILFFDKCKADGANEGLSTKETWFYRLDMPKGYKHFSKTKPMKLEHCQPIRDWWNNRVEISETNDDGEIIGYKSRCYTAKELIDRNYDFDLCKFPKETEDVLPPTELFEDYEKRRSAFDAKIDNLLSEIKNLIGLDTENK